MYKGNSLYMSLPHASHSWLGHASFLMFFFLFQNYLNESLSKFVKI